MSLKTIHHIHPIHLFIQARWLRGYAFRKSFGIWP
jgi:hypothetical protein